MRRHNCGVDGGLIRGASKIRKRGCSSSSSSSTTMRKRRFKRALLIRKRGRLSPIWKMNSKVSNSSIKNTESPTSLTSQNVGKGKRMPVSGRKLAASLWEMNEIASPRMRNCVESRRKNKGRNIDMMQRPVCSASLQRHLFGPSHTPVSECMRRSKTHLHKRTSADNCNFGSLSSWRRATSMEIADCSRGLSHLRTCIDDKTSLKKLRNIMVSCLELLKLLGHIWEHKDQYFSGMFVVSALNSELNRARRQINQIIQEQHAHSDHKRLKDEAALKSEEQERIRAAIKSISGDLEREKKLRRRSEKFSKTLFRELALTKNALLKATKDVKSEKRAREILEQACNELARGIGEDRAEVEELRRKSTKVQEEVEKEREMLHLADMLREERVQMKLSEAKYQFEEKNAVVDKMRNELQVFLKTKQNVCGTQNHEEDAYHSKVKDWYAEKGGIDDGEECRDGNFEEDSSEGELHSIELNVDGTTRSYTWNYATSAYDQGNSTNIAIEEVGLKGSKCTNTDKLAPGEMSLARQISEGIEWDFSTGNVPVQVMGHDYQRETSNKDFKIGVESTELIKALRDYILSNSKETSTKGLARSTQNSHHILSSRDTYQECSL